MKLGVIGGSGLYQLDTKVRGESLRVETPFGETSSPIVSYRFPEVELLFIARHGEGHRFLPSEVNYRANIFAMKKLGASAVLSVSAVGSLQGKIAPGEMVLPDQYVDRTTGVRPSTFFGGGVVAHAHFADPACASLRGHVASLLESLSIPVRMGGTYVCMEGPQFSTRAESHWYRSWASDRRTIDVIGMTALPEAKLAREAGLCYQTVAMATDYDCWNEEVEHVTLEMVLRTLHDNVAKSQRLIAALSERPYRHCANHCASAMKQAVVTAAELWPQDRRATLEVILK